MQARTCYDHFAGTLGVWLYDRLVDLEAIEAVGEIRGMWRSGDTPNDG